MAASSAVALSGSAARVATMVSPAAMNDDRVNSRIDEAVLALLYQGVFEHHPVMGGAVVEGLRLGSDGSATRQGPDIGPGEQGQVGATHRNRFTGSRSGLPPVVRNR